MPVKVRVHASVWAAKWLPFELKVVPGFTCS